MEVKDKDHRIYMAEYGVPTLQLGCGGTAMCSVTSKEDGLHGVAFVMIDNDVIGKEFPEHTGKKVDDIGASLQILSSSKESLLVLREKIDEAIEFFD